MNKDNSLKAAVIGGIIAGLSSLLAAVAPLFVSSATPPETETTPPAAAAVQATPASAGRETSERIGHQNAGEAKPVRGGKVFSADRASDGKGRSPR